MKTKYLKGISALGLGLLLFSSCLKDNTYRNFDPESTASSVADLPISGIANFAADARTKAGIDTVTFAVEISQASPLSAAQTVTIGVDNSYVAKYNALQTAIAYVALPTTAYKLPATAITIPAGVNYVLAKVILDRTSLDPSLSYMLPVVITNSGSTNTIISGNFNVHYYHIIGNDFAGAYIWDYRRYQNGTGPGAGQIPSQGQGLPFDAGVSGIGRAGLVNPVGPTEIAMLTGYNSTGVNYDITFTRTPGTPVTYTNWKVFFNADNIALWTAAGITNFVPPAFTVPPPANSNSPKLFEMNYISGGSATTQRYIDDTYHK